MTSKRSKEFAVCRDSNGHEIAPVLVNFPFGKLGSGGRIERLDFTASGHGKQLTVYGPVNGNHRIPVSQWVLDDDELIAIVTVKDADGVFTVASSGNMSAIRGELDSSDRTIMFERANQSVPICDAQMFAFESPVPVANLVESGEMSTASTYTVPSTSVTFSCKSASHTLAPSIVPHTTHL